MAMIVTQSLVWVSGTCHLKATVQLLITLASSNCPHQGFLLQMSMWGTAYVGKFSKRAFIISKKPTREKYILFRSFKKFF